LEVLERGVVVAGIEIRDDSIWVFQPEMFIPLAQERRHGFVLVAGESRRDVRQSRRKRELVGQAVLELDDAEERLRRHGAFDFDAVLFEMPFVRETLKLDGDATFTADGNPRGLRTHPDRKGEEKNDQNGDQPLRGVAPREATASAMVVRY
jgi:hypothetical protein